MMERNYKLPKEGGLEPGADPADKGVPLLPGTVPYSR